MSPLKRKILLLLVTGISFGHSYTPQRQIRVLKEFGSEWKKINEKELQKAIKELYKTKTVEIKENSDGTHTLVLTKQGKLKSFTYHFREMKLKKVNWDGKWRIVIFDIPEKLRRGRDALRDKLKNLGFYELQKSVFVFPYQCEQEIEFIIEFFSLRKYVRFGVLDSIDNSLHLKKIFKLT